MSKQSPFAREEVMEAYLDSLLKEPEAPEDVTARTAKLLEQASQQMAESALASTANVNESLKNEQEALAEKVTSLIETQKAETIESEKQEAHTETLVESQQETALSRSEKTKIPLKDTLGFRFQALFFEVAGLTLAVPLTSLGGIHQIEKIGPLFGKPDWFMGVMLHRESKLSVVVKWRESTGKRPWLAGMVKEKMCALIDVEELISMLNKGLGSNDQTP